MISFYEAIELLAKVMELPVINEDFDTFKAKMQGYIEFEQNLCMLLDD